jgi:hypothetical protein
MRIRIPNTLTEKEVATPSDLVSGNEPVLLLRLVPLYDHGGGGEGTDLHVARRGSRTCNNARPARLYTSSKLIPNISKNLKIFL